MPSLPNSLAIMIPDGACDTSAGHISKNNRKAWTSTPTETVIVKTN